MEEKNEKRGRKMKDLLQNAPNNGEGTEEYISQGFAYEHGLDVEENYIEAAKCKQQYFAQYFIYIHFVAFVYFQWSLHPCSRILYLRSVLLRCKDSALFFAGILPFGSLQEVP